MADEDDFSTLGIADKIAHKSWKARLLGYEELKKTWEGVEDPADPEFRRWADDIKKMVLDSNQVAQEAALAATLVYVDFAGIAPKLRGAVVPALVDKSLGSMRAGTRAKAVDIILTFIDIDDSPDAVVGDVIAGLAAKQPKLVAASVSLLKDIVGAYGAKTVNVKPIFKVLVQIFGHADKNVRAEGSLLAVELYKWTGRAAFEVAFKDMKPVQVKELTDLFDAIPADSKPKQIRFLRSQKPPTEVAVTSGVIEGTSSANVQEAEDAGESVIDPYELADPVDVLSKIPAKYYDTFRSTSWKERKEVLEELVKILSTPRMADGSYHQLVNALAKLVGDSNIVCSVLADNCIELLAKGLRHAFVPYKSAAIAPLLDRLKEKKVSVQQAIKNALEAIFLTTSLPEIVEDIAVGLNNKNPIARSETAQWLVRCLNASKKVPGKEDIKALMTALVKNIEDSTTEVRESSACAIGTLKKVAGERAVSKYIEKLDALKLNKIEEYYQAAKSPSGAAVEPTSVSGKAPTARVPPKPLTASSAGKENSPPAAVKAKPKSVTRPSSGNSLKSSTKSSLNKSANVLAPSQQESESVVKYKYTDEDADAAAAELLTDAVLSQFKDSQWKTRLEACESVVARLYKLLSAEPPTDPELLFRVMRRQPVWKDNNFQVMSQLFAMFSRCAQKDISLSRGAQAMAIPVLVDKLGDMKLKTAAIDVLNLFVEQSSMQFVFSKCYEPISAQKSPKVIAEALKTLGGLIMTFGVATLDLRSLVAFTKFHLSSSNAAVRSSAVSLLGNLRIFVGADLRSLLVSDISAALMATIDAEFQRVADTPIPENLRKQPSTGGQRKSSAAENASTDDLFPRLDISTAITPEILENIMNASWKLRKEGLDSIASILSTTHTRIKPQLGELLPALKARLEDSNKNLVIQTLEIISTMCRATGPPFERAVKTIMSGCLSNLTDNKAQVRQAVLATLDALCEHGVSLSAIIPSAATSLAVDNPNLRKDLLAWLVGKLPAKNDVNVDVTSLVPAVFACLQDRNQDVRKAAQSLLPLVAQLCGSSYVRQKCQDLKGTALSTVSPFVDMLPSTQSGQEAAMNDASPAPPGSPAPSRLLKKTASSQGVSSSSGSLLTRSNSSRLTLTKKKSMSLSTLKAPVASSSIADGSTTTISSQPLILPADLRLKEKRAEQDRGMHKWTFDAPRKELIDFLHEQAEACLSPPLVSLLFTSDNHHKDRDYYSGLCSLDECFIQCLQSQDHVDIPAAETRLRIVSVTDVVFKYLTIRLFDTNTSTMLKILDLLEHFVAILDMAGYQMTEHEANAFLGFFINKVGDNKETIRTRIRGIMRSICRIYPASKMFGHVLACVGVSKNAKTRAECLEELGCLIQRNGAGVLMPASKTLPGLAAQIADRDSNVRSAALNAIVEAYCLLGEQQVMKHLARISEKDRSLLDERLKRSKANVNTAKTATSSRSSPTKPMDGAVPARPEESQDVAAVDQQQQQMKKRFTLDLDQLSLPQLSEPTTSGDDNPNRQPQPAVTSTRSSAPFADQSEFAMDFIQTQITSGDVFQSIDALKQLENFVNTRPDLVQAQMNPLVNAVTLQVRLAFTSPVNTLGTESATLLRQCKHLVNVLVQMFSLRQLARELSKETTHQLLSELLARLVDQRLQLALGESGTQLTRALNVLMIRILENCNKNLVFSVLLDLLDTGVASLQGLPESELALQAKYAELVMKCLWKWTKSLQDTLRANEIVVGPLLLDLHKFLATNPPVEWKRRAAEQLPLGDMPLRTAKTIMHELAMGVGAPIMEMMMNCGVEEPSRSVVHAYLLHMLQAAGIAVAAPVDLAKQPPSPASNVSRSNSAQSVGMSTPGPLTDTELTSAIDAIFQKIASKDDTKQGVQELYMFQQQHLRDGGHVHEKIKEKLATHGVNFRMYIRNTLERIAQERGEVAIDYSASSTLATSGSASALSTSAMSSTTSLNQGDTADYKERLERLQQRFGYGSSAAPEANVVTAPNSVPSETVPADLPSTSAQEQSVLALKERLARMKTTMMRQT